MSYVLVPIGKQNGKPAVKKVAEKKTYSDILHIQSWSNQLLLKRHDKITKRAKEYMLKVDKLSSADDDKSQTLIKDFKIALRIVEIIEDEGRRRQIIPFIPDNELEEIFGAPVMSDTNDDNPSGY